MGLGAEHVEEEGGEVEVAKVIHPDLSLESLPESHVESTSPAN